MNFLEGLLGFVLAFVRLANANISVSFQSSWSIKSVTNLFNPSDILTHEWELSLFTDSVQMSAPYLLCCQMVVASHAGPILVFPRIQLFGSVDFPSRGKVYSRHVTGSANCENSSVCFVMKYCPTPTVFRNPESVHIKINRSGCGSLSTRFLYLCNRFSCAGISIEGLGVIINRFAGADSVSDCSADTGLLVLVWQLLYSSHKSETATWI